MKKNYNYDFLLPFFVASDCLRTDMYHVHKDEDGYIYATNAHIVIRIPSDKVGNEYKAIENFPNAGKIVSEALTRPGNISRSIAVDDLIMILSKAKWYKEARSVVCPTCDGDGEVEYSECEHFHDCDKCSECNGTGEINNRVAEFSLLQEKDYFVVKIEQQHFKASYLHILAISAKVAGFETIEFESDPANKSSSAIFKFDDIVILIMPFMALNSDMELKTKICTK